MTFGITIIILVWPKLLNVTWNDTKYCTLVGNKEVLLGMTLIILIGWKIVK